MKTFAVLSLVIAAATAAESRAPSLTELTNNLPTCAEAAMKASMQEQKCNVAHVDASAFDCLCDNYYDVTGGVFDKVPFSCAADFSKDAGAVCGVWAIEGPSASDITQAVAALAAKVGGAAQDGNRSSAPVAASTAPSSSKISASSPTNVAGETVARVAQGASPTSTIEPASSAADRCYDLSLFSIFMILWSVAFVL